MPAIGGHCNSVALSRPRGGRLAIGEAVIIKMRGLLSLAARFSVALPYGINITSLVTNQAEKFRCARNIKLHYELNDFWEAFFVFERRKHTRRQIFKFGMLNYRCLAKLGVVKNISPTGAMVAVENSIGVPDNLSLDVEANLHTGPCHVVWKNAKEIGVRFV